MSGVFGIVDPRGQRSVHTLIDLMSNAMSHRNWFVAESFVNDEHDLAIGRIGIGIFNQV